MCSSSFSGRQVRHQGSSGHLVAPTYEVVRYICCILPYSNNSEAIIHGYRSFFIFRSNMYFEGNPVAKFCSKIVWGPP